MLDTLWQRMSGIKLAPYSTTAQIAIVDGQSLAVGFSEAESFSAHLTYVSRRGVKMLNGLTANGGAQVKLEGPGSWPYDAGTAATAVVPALSSGRTPSVFTFALALDKWRAKLRSPHSPLIAGCNAVPGQSVDAFQPGGTIRNNHLTWETQAVAISPGAVPVAYGWMQGEADVAQTADWYLPRAISAIDAALADIETATGHRPRVLIWQTGGYRDSAGKPYGPPLAQLDLVAHYDAVFAGPLHGYPLRDEVHPTLAAQTVYTEIAAMVLAHQEAGQNINLLPGAAVWTGNSVRIPFSTWGGRPLMFDPVDKFAAYGGLTNHGVEATGANITSVALDGNAVVVTCDGPMTQVQIAMQSQTITAQDGSNQSYAAHRCDIMESAPEDSLMIPGSPLKRFIPSCRFVRSA